MSNLYAAWIDDKKVPDKRAKAFMEYVERNRDNLIPIGDFVFDSASLSSRIMLQKCLDCLRYQKNDCCNGNSYPVPREQIEKINPHVPEILALVPDSEYAVDSFYRYGAFTRNGATTVRGNKEGNCIFSYRDSDGCSKCAIHSWCLNTGRNPYEYKPYTCSTFPMEGIVTPSGKTFVFLPCKETLGFSMHFYTLTRRVCINESNMLRVYADKGTGSYIRGVNSDNVIKDDLLKYFRPAYLELEGILRHLCGNDVYEELVRQIQ